MTVSPVRGTALIANVPTARIHPNLKRFAPKLFQTQERRTLTLSSQGFRRSYKVLGFRTLHRQRMFLGVGAKSLHVLRSIANASRLVSFAVEIVSVRDARTLWDLRLSSIGGAK